MISWLRFTSRIGENACDSIHFGNPALFRIISTHQRNPYVAFHRITPSEEIALGEKTQTYMQLQALQSNLAKELGRAPTDEEWCAASGRINLQSVETIMKEGLEAKNKLVTANLRLVQRVVNVYIRNGLSSQYNAGDLMQEGTIALIRAAETFEPSKGFRFSTYAMFWIRASVKR